MNVFNKKPHTDWKRSLQKFLDGKKDTATRFRHLRVVLDHIDVSETKNFFENNYSQIYFVVYDLFIITENNLKLKGTSKAQKEDLESVLHVFERVLIYLPELLKQRWQYHSVSRIFRKILHPGNTFRLRKEATRLFLQYYQAVADPNDAPLNAIFATLVPGFPTPSDGPGLSYSSAYQQNATDPSHPVVPVDLQPIIPQQPSEKIPDDSTRFFLEGLLEYMVSQVTKLDWRDKSFARQQASFSFLLEQFKRYYLPYIFPDFSSSYNVYRLSNELPELRTMSHIDRDPYTSCRVVVIKFMANYTHAWCRSDVWQKLDASPMYGGGGDSVGALTPDSRRSGSFTHDNSPAMDTSFLSQVSDKEPASLFYMGEEHPSLEMAIVQDVLFSTRENVNLVHEVFRQAFLLPFHQSAAIRRVIALYRDWIQKKVDVPPFMHEPEDMSPCPARYSSDSLDYSEAKLVLKGSEKERIKAGLQNILHVFITNAAHVFLLEIPPGSLVLLEEQVDTCKRVLNIYRHMVMNTRMEQKTWEQLLLILLQITSQVLGEKVPKNKEETLGGRLAPALFQTLIVTWIRANLNVIVSTELWDQFVNVLSSLTTWEELIREWAKTMETLTRVLVRNLYGLDLNDLPLDRLSEQKAKKRRAGRINMDEGMEMRQNFSYVKPKPTSLPVSSQQVTSHDEDRSTGGGSVRSHDSSIAHVRPGLPIVRHRRESFEDSSLHVWSLGHHQQPRLKRSFSEGNLRTRRSHSSKSGRSRHKSHPAGPFTVPVLPVAVEQELLRILSHAKAGTPTREATTPVKPPRKAFGPRKRSRSMDSLRHLRLATLSQYSDSEGASRSPSPAPSSGLETNSIKDSPLQIDMLGAEGGSLEANEAHSLSETRSVMAGGTVRGWLPDVAVVLWRRMLGALGDINEVQDPTIYGKIMEYLVDLCGTLIKIRQNQGVSLDNLSTPPLPEFVPPLYLLAPWCFKAFSLPAEYQKGKLHALRLLCQLTVRPQDLPLPKTHLLQFYRVLHTGLVNNDTEVINTLVKHCGPRFLSLQLPGFSSLFLDLLYGANTVISSTEIKESPRTEAASILGSLLCFPHVMHNMPALQPTPNEFKLISCPDFKDHIVSVLLKAAKREPTGLARCISICSLGLYLYGELVHRTFHSKLRDVLSVLLAVLRQAAPSPTVRLAPSAEFKNRAVGQVACDVLLLLCDHAPLLLEHFPDIPKKIIEDLAYTFASLAAVSPANCSDEDKRLLLSLNFTLGEWCMRVPQGVLLRDAPQSLLFTVFKVLKCVATGTNGYSSHLSTPVSETPPTDITMDISVDNMKESFSSLPSSPASDNNPSPAITTRLQRQIQASDALSSVRLAARMLMTHLVNHLNHFPLGIGASRLSSLVVEQDDIPGLPLCDDLSSDVFQSPYVQFFVLNQSTLMSLVQLPALEVPGGGVTAGLKTASSQVRVILRDLSGKACWDASILYGLQEEATLTRQSRYSSFAQTPTFVTTHSQLQSSHSNGIGDGYHRTKSDDMLMISSFVGLTGGAGTQVSPPRCSLRHRPLGVLPVYEDTALDMDNLEDLLLYLGHTSPECVGAHRTDWPLTNPAPVPKSLPSEVEEEAFTALLNQRNLELDYLSKHAYDASAVAPRQTEPIPDEPDSAFYLCRLLFSQMGLFSWEKRSQINLLKKNERLLRELKNLDSQKCRETHKIAVVYVAEGQEDKTSILSNSGGSQAFEDFIAAMAWEVELESHTGFMGGLQRNKTTGETAPYYATSFVEVMFHVSTRMPSNTQEALLQKTRHLGNDEVHIVWSEHSRDYRRGIIPTEFCDVLIVIYPLPHGLHRIQISRKPDVPFVGPLFNECVVDKQSLPGLVRATALNASKAKRSMLPLYQTFYEERTKALESLIENHKQTSTFEEFASQVFAPVGKPGSMLLQRASGITFAPLDSSGSFIGSGSGPSSTNSSLTAALMLDSGPAGFLKTVDNRNRDSSHGDEDLFASPKANKRLSFKNAGRKVSVKGE